MSPRRSRDFGEAERADFNHCHFVWCNIPPGSFTKATHFPFCEWVKAACRFLSKAGGALELVDKVAIKETHSFKTEIYISWCGSCMRCFPPVLSLSLLALMSVRIVMPNFLEAIKSKWRLWTCIHCAPSQPARSQMRHFNYCARLDGDVCRQHFPCKRDRLA